MNSYAVYLDKGRKTIKKIVKANNLQDALNAAKQAYPDRTISMFWQIW